MLKKNIIFFILNITNIYSFTNIFNNIKVMRFKPLALIDNNPYIEQYNKFFKHNIENIRYSKFLLKVQNGDIKKTFFTDDGNKLYIYDKENNEYKIDKLPNDKDLINILNKNNVEIEVENYMGKMYVETLKFIIIYLATSYIVLRLTRYILTNNNQEQQYKNIKENINITFDDVAGIDSYKYELQEVVEFLKDDELYTSVGATIPKGILLEGPPGTGKTLLARAVAGEANVPFYSTSGSEFIELFVGTGASRVRKLFNDAKQNSPCIIFIDEIDAIGRQRGNGMNTNDEREQTLNQLLTEMDGFEGNTGIIVIAATNRGDILDNALLRPGRFDRRILVDNPDYEGRIEILKLYGKNKPMSSDIDYEEIAQSTPNFSGAMLQNLLNEAAIFTVRNNETEITNKNIYDALDKITIGIAKKSRENSLKNKELVAVHEAGHAIVAFNKKNYDKVSRFSIIPRGNAGGVTIFTPDEERVSSGLYTKDYLESLIEVALGGRIAEEVIFGIDEITTGASNDLERITSVARNMIMDYGMNKEIGHLNINDMEISMSLKNKIDEEILKLVNNSYNNVKKLLLENKENIKNVAKKLIEKETITGEEFENILKDNYDLSVLP